MGVFRITAYWMNEDEYGDMTSTGVKAQINHTIAVDPTVIPYGSKVKIDGQIYVAEDCGGAVKNNVIDVWVEHPSNSFGVKYKAYAPEEYADWAYNEVRTQTGCTENEAKEYLEAHLQFEYCNDKTFRDLQIELIDQFY